jgi:energy-coupling factor transporter ATP-binding protein EcfA2
VTITFDELSFSYPASSQRALDSVTTTIVSGRVTLLTGPLGAGASTALLVASGIAPRVIGGTLRGKVSVLGADPASVAGRRALAGRVGLLLSTPWTQLSGMAPTVADEVAFGPANLGWERDRIMAAVDRAMDRVGARHLADRDPSSLSGGELQRVMIAALVALDPQVYLLDEPALELDPAGADMLYQLLPELARRATVLVASTDVDRAVEVADAVMLLDRGRCIAQGSPDAVLGTDAAVRAGWSTTIAGIACEAGLSPIYPLTLGAAARRFGP